MHLKCFPRLCLFPFAIDITLLPEERLIAELVMENILENDPRRCLGAQDKPMVHYDSTLHRFLTQVVARTDTGFVAGEYM